MHEMALAEAVVATALAEADRQGYSRITRLEVRIGELQKIEPDVLEFALREVLPADEPRIRDTEIVLSTARARFTCRACGRSFGFGEAGGGESDDESESMHFLPELAHAFLECPDCHSPDFEVVEGRGVTIEDLAGR